MENCIGPTGASKADESFGITSSGSENKIKKQVSQAANPRGPGPEGSGIVSTSIECRETESLQEKRRLWSDEEEAELSQEECELWDDEEFGNESPFNSESLDQSNEAEHAIGSAREAIGTKIKELKDALASIAKRDNKCKNSTSKQTKILIAKIFKKLSAAGNMASEHDKKINEISQRTDAAINELRTNNASDETKVQGRIAKLTKACRAAAPKAEPWIMKKLYAMENKLAKIGERFKKIVNTERTKETKAIAKENEKFSKTWHRLEVQINADLKATEKEIEKAEKEIKKANRSSIAVAPSDEGEFTLFQSGLNTKELDWLLKERSESEDAAHDVSTPEVKDRDVSGSGDGFYHLNGAAGDADFKDDIW
jgi:hypothetical protein